jgi:hypothetical protein
VKENDSQDYRLAARIRPIDVLATISLAIGTVTAIVLPFFCDLNVIGHLSILTAIGLPIVWFVLRINKIAYLAKKSKETSN